MNPARFLAAIAAIAAFLPLLAVAPGRIAPGSPVGFAQALTAWHWITLTLCWAGLVLTENLPRRRFLAPIFAAAASLLLLDGAGEAARHLAIHGARASLGSGFWLGEAALLLLILRRIDLPVLAAFGAGLAALAASHRLDALSLVIEYRSREAAFAAALARHLTLSFGAAALAIAFAAGLTLAIRGPRGRAALLAALDIVQTVPSVALFGLLIAPLTAAGLSGIGVIPALIALTLYGLLPATRGLLAALGAVDPAILDSARGLGFSPLDRFRLVTLPLATPALIAGLRVLIVQMIGLTVVAALIGAGGLGDFVFQGLGQYATDLILLGALPALALALTADRLLATR